MAGPLILWGFRDLPGGPRAETRTGNASFPAGMCLTWTGSLSDQAFEVCDPWVTCIQNLLGCELRMQMLGPYPSPTWSGYLWLGCRNLHFQ